MEKPLIRTINYQREGDYCYFLCCWIIQVVRMDLRLKIIIKSVKVIPQARALNNDKFCLDRVNYLDLVFF